MEHYLAFVIGGFTLLLGPVKQGFTVLQMVFRKICKNLAMKAIHLFKWLYDYILLSYHPPPKKPNGGRRRYSFESFAGKRSMYG